jgi:hypothetical protein
MLRGPGVAVQGERFCRRGGHGVAATLTMDSSFVVQTSDIDLLFTPRQFFCGESSTLQGVNGVGPESSATL